MKKLDNIQKAILVQGAMCSKVKYWQGIKNKKRGSNRNLVVKYELEIGEENCKEGER